MLQVQQLTFNPFAENTYVLFNENKNAIIVDPGNYFPEEDKALLEFIEANDLSVKMLINTHCHIDHVFGNKFVCETFNIEPMFHKGEEVIFQNAPQAALKWGVELNHFTGKYSFISEDDSVKMNDDELVVIAAPGHSPGHICLYCKKQNFLIGGDVLFYESIGRTDLPFGNHEELIKNIKEKIFALPDETIVYAGHGQYTIIKHEKMHNPFVN
jgi:glyoxylase-like metal-dependent hydrolase (beta-lactamase superfamily II)